jgi:hypothetical protein
MQGGEGKESGVCNAVRKVVCAMRNVVTELTENGTDLTHMVRSDVGNKPPPPIPTVVIPETAAITP